MRFEYNDVAGRIMANEQKRKQELADMYKRLLELESKLQKEHEENVGKSYA